MNTLMAIISHHCLDEVRTALIEQGLRGLTVTEIKRYDFRQYRSDGNRIGWIRAVKLEAIVTEEQVQRAISAIVETVRKTSQADGLVFLLDSEKVLRVRTGETGPNAI